MERTLSKKELDLYFSAHDLKRIEVYSKNMADYHLVMDLLPALAKLFFLDRTNIALSTAQKVGIRALKWGFPSGPPAASKQKLSPAWRCRGMSRVFCIRRYSAWPTFLLDVAQHLFWVNPRVICTVSDLVSRATSDRNNQTHCVAAEREGTCQPVYRISAASNPRSGFHLQTCLVLPATCTSQWSTAVHLTFDFPPRSCFLSAR